ETIILLRIVHARLDAHVFKRAIRLLVIKRIAFTGQSTWAAHHRRTAKLATSTTGLSNITRARRQIVEIDLNVTRNEEIEPSITIVIAPTRARAPAFARDAQLLCDVGERAVAVVAIKSRDTEVGDIHVRAAVVVVITNRDAHPPALVCYSGFLSD